MINLSFGGGLLSDWNCPGATRWSCWRTWSWESGREGSTSRGPHATGPSRISWPCPRSGRTIPAGELLAPLKTVVKQSVGWPLVLRTNVMGEVDGVEA